MPGKMVDSFQAHFVELKGLIKVSLNRITRTQFIEKIETDSVCDPYYFC